MLLIGIPTGILTGITAREAIRVLKRHNIEMKFPKTKVVLPIEEVVE